MGNCKEFIKKDNEKNIENDYAVDFVVTWVDGNDPEWQAERGCYVEDNLGRVDSSRARYRDMGLMRYWFRSVERYAPWVRNVYFVTWGHIPEWLDINSPKLKIVKHEDFIDEEYLPVFNCNPIEIFLHKIEGLSEHFIYFNDDVFLTAPVTKDWFYKNGKPKDMLALQPVIANPKNPVMSRLYLNNSIVISKHFNKRENMLNNLSNYFHLGYPLKYFIYNFLELSFPQYTGFYTYHGPYRMLKSNMEDLWDKEEEILRTTASQRFRSVDDVTLYLFVEWNKLKGNFYPVNIHKGFKYFDLGVNREDLKKAILGKKIKNICINDVSTHMTDEEYDTYVREIAGWFEQSLPDKSSFEKN